MNYINIGIVVTALLSIVLVLLQNRGSEGGALSSGDAGGFYQKRRGMEKVIFGLTILSLSLFAIFSVFRITPWGKYQTAPAPASQIELKTDNPNIKIEAVPVSPENDKSAAPAPAPSVNQTK